MFLVVVALVVAIWIIGQTIGQVLMVFLFTVVLALLLNPAVRFLNRRHIPRGLAVAMVFLALLALVVGVIALVVTPVRSQIQTIHAQLPTYRAEASSQISSLQRFLHRHGIHANVAKGLNSLSNDIQSRLTQGTSNVLSYSLGVLNVIVTIVITLVAAIYMVLDAPRILRLARRMGGDPTADFLRRTEHTLMRYLRAQVLVSLLISLSVGLVLWLLGVTGVFPLGATFAVTFMTLVFLFDFVPYLGPVLGAIPPVGLALLTSVTAAVCVVVAFVVIHETVRRVVPKAMSDAAGVQPLVVIFGLLIGAQLAGVVGVVLAIPMVVIAKEAAVVLADYSAARRAVAGEAPTDVPEVVPAAPADPPAPPGGTSVPAGTRRDETALEP
jgi:predicted PurR-regulated permease PerM